MRQPSFASNIVLFSVLGAGLAACDGQQGSAGLPQAADENAPIPDVPAAPSETAASDPNLLEWAEATHVNLSTIAAQRWGFRSRAWT